MVQTCIAEVRLLTDAWLRAKAPHPTVAHMRGPLCAAAISVLCGCGSESTDPRNAWLGSYAGSLFAEARDCGTGERLEPVDADVRLTVVALGNHLAIDGGCLIEFDLTSNTRGRIRPFTCDRALEDGTPIRTVFVSGIVELDGDELYFEMSTEVSTPEWCETSADTFVGLRE